MTFDAESADFVLNESFESLAVSEMETNRIVSPIDKDLLIQSDARLDLVTTLTSLSSIRCKQNIGGQYLSLMKNVFSSVMKNAAG